MTDLNASRPPNNLIKFIDIDRSGIAISDLVIGIFEIPVIFLAIILNALCLRTFTSRRSHVSNLLYSLIVMNDIASGLAAIPTALSLIRNRDAVLLGNAVLCDLTGFLFTLTSRMSVFLVGVLSVARAISICLPFIRQRIRYHITLLVVGYVVNLTVAIIPFGLAYTVGDTAYFYDAATAACILNWKNYKKVVENKTVFNVTAGMFYAILPWLLPGLVILISCITSLGSIYKPTARAHSREGDAEMRHASITIILITAVYIVCNTPVWVYLALFLAHNSALLYMPPLHYCTLTHLVIYTSVLVNAALNPIVYVARMDRVRANVRKLLLQDKIQPVAVLTLSLPNTVSHLHRFSH